MNKFEQLIEYVINDEEAKARELFHDIVVEKSRQIYEEMMEEETVEESEETVEEAKHDDAEDEDKEKMDEAMDETMGGDQSDDLIDDIEVEEEGIAIEGEGEEAAEDLEDRVVDLEDKLDELMAEFEALMGDEGAGDSEEIDTDIEMDMDTPDMDAEEVADDELETEGMKMPMEEAVTLKAVPKPQHGDDGANAKSPVAANSGAKGAVAKPVSTTGGEAQGRTAPTAKDAIGKVGNTPAQSTQEPKPATKPHLAQATGVNTKSPLPRQ